MCQAGKVQQPQNQLYQRTDFTDTVIIFKSYSDDKLENLKEELSTGNGFTNNDNNSNMKKCQRVSVKFKNDDKQSNTLATTRALEV